MVLERFHPTVGRWFQERLGDPSPPQQFGWPLIGEGKNVLIAAPTGSGKTLTAFLSAIDLLLRQGEELQPRTEVLYISPLKALSNDVAKNLIAPLAEMRELDPDLPEIAVSVRTGDTAQKDRARMLRKPPHILVTTPESLYILLTSDGGRRLLKSVKTVIVDEIHALARDKRGSHLSLSLERLEALCRNGHGDLQRIGLSATQKPLDEIGRFLVGVDRRVETVDVGHLRALDLDVELPGSPLTAVCSHEVWEEIYARMTELILEHRTTLLFVNTRKMAERLSLRLSERLGEDQVRCHHGSLSREIRLDAEQKLKAGELKALVATASLELGIDIGDVDLAIQVGSVRSIATFLQRMGRAGHGLDQVSKGRLFPLTLDELVEAAALLRATRRGELDRVHLPEKPLDILAQQLVAACASEDWREDDLFRLVCRAWPYRALSREEFDEAVALHSEGRRALIHRDGVNRELKATRRTRLRSITNGGAIPDTGDYRVILEPEGIQIGSINEDFAIESNRGDIFQLGSSSWRILRVEMGTVRVADAHGLPPTLPFWLGEAPGRTAELSAEIAELRETVTDRDTLIADTGLPEAAARQICDYFDASRAVLGPLPTTRRLIAERFFDEGGGTQIVVHAPFGSRINRALGLSLRKRICRGFGFELQAAANDEAIIFSLGEKPGIPLDDLFQWLTPDSVEHLLVQAMLVTPMFENRWRWNVSRSLLVERMRGGKPIPILLQKMRANDLLLDAFPQSLACPETLDSPDVEVPMDHPLVRQTVHDCLHEAMDLDGMIEVLKGLGDGSLESLVLDTGTPSPLAHGILAAGPYAFLDDAPLEERRARAVQTRHVSDPQQQDELGALDPDAIAAVKDEAWPDPRDAEEVHEALCWMGFVTDQEAPGWRDWLRELSQAGRVALEGERWYATEATRDPKAVLRGRMEALGPVFDDDPLLRELEADGDLLPIRDRGRQGFCNRRLLKRIRNRTLNRLRSEIEPVSAAQFVRFLACWQHLDEGFRLEGPAGVSRVVEQLAGFEAPAREWEKSLLPARVRGYRREWLDQVTLSGEVVWGRLFGGGATPIKTTPIALFRRQEFDAWLALSEPGDRDLLSGNGRAVLELLEQGGALFPDELRRKADLLPVQLDETIAELIAFGWISADSFAALRGLLRPPSARSGAIQTSGRFSLLHRPAAVDAEDDAVEFVARQYLKRTGVVFRRTIAREKIPLPWRRLLRFLRTLELRGEVRGGRFVKGFDGEQYALPEAVELLRSVRRKEEQPSVEVSAADPLNLRGILTPEPRVPPSAKERVLVV